MGIADRFSDFVDKASESARETFGEMTDQDAERATQEESGTENANPEGREQDYLAADDLAPDDSPAQDSEADSSEHRDEGPDEDTLEALGEDGGANLLNRPY